MTKPNVGKNLKAFVDAGKKQSRVLKSVERFVISKPKDTTRSNLVLHPSEMSKPDWCYRASYYELLGRTPAEGKYAKNLKMENVFRNGHDVHTRWQEDFGDMGVLYGLWKCRGCEETQWGFKKDIHICNGTAPKYLEVPLNYAPLKIGGKADGCLVGLGNPLTLEIKSIGVGTVRYERPDIFYENDGHATKIWDAIDAPFQSHITQAKIYTKLMGLLELDFQPQEMLFLYEFKGTQEVKEFVVPMSDFGITEIFDAAAMISAAVDNLTPPACNIGGSAGCDRCRVHTEEEFPAW